MDIGKPLERRRVYPLVEPAQPQQEPQRTAPPAPVEKPVKQPEKVE